MSYFQGEIPYYLMSSYALAMLMYIVHIQAMKNELSVCAFEP